MMWKMIEQLLPYTRGENSRFIFRSVPNMRCSWARLNINPKIWSATSFWYRSELNHVELAHHLSALYLYSNCLL